MTLADAVLAAMRGEPTGWGGCRLRGRGWKTYSARVARRDV